MPFGATTKYAKASKAGYNESGATIEFAPGEFKIPWFTIRLAEGTVSGFVLDANGEGIDGALVNASNGSSWASNYTDPGYYEIHGLSEGNYNLTVTKNSWYIGETKSVSVSGGASTTQNLTMQNAPGSVSGSVGDADGAPIAGATVSLANENGTYSNTTGETGRFTVYGVPFGAYSFTASRNASYQNNTKQVVVLPGGQATQDSACNGPP